MIVEQWKTTDVKPYENNPRQNDQAVGAVVPWPMTAYG